MYPVLYRRRLIPDECVLLKDDIILHMDDSVLVTKWNTLKPRKDFHHGYSCYFFKEGIKVSKFLREDGSLLYWYCDVVNFERSDDGNTLTVIDLLVDVTLDPEGRMKVLDIDELCEAYKTGLIDDGMFHTAVERLGLLTDAVQSGRFGTYTDVVDSYSK